MQNGRWSVDIVLRTSYVQVIFRHTSFAEKQGGHVLTPDFGTVNNLFNMASNGEVIYIKAFHIVDMNIFEVWAIAIRSHLEGRSCV